MKNCFDDQTTSFRGSDEEIGIQSYSVEDSVNELEVGDVVKHLSRKQDDRKMVVQALFHALP